MVCIMGNDLGKTFNQLLTVMMLVTVLIACERMPERDTLQNQPSFIPHNFNAH